jgi:hypothetical protein
MVRATVASFYSTLEDAWGEPERKQPLPQARVQQPVQQQSSQSPQAHVQAHVQQQQQQPSPSPQAQVQAHVQQQPMKPRRGRTEHFYHGSDDGEEGDDAAADRECGIEGCDHHPSIPRRASESFSNGGGEPMADQREYINLALFVLSGVILIFIMEQFIVIGQAMAARA